LKRLVAVAGPVSECGGGADWFETKTVKKCRTEFAEGAAVVWGGIAFVGNEIVGGKDFVPAGHAFIAVHFGDDGGGGDGAAAGVPIDEGKLFYGEVDFHKINQ